MNDNTNPAPEMPGSSSASKFDPLLPTLPRSRSTFTDWLKRLLVCNPFYLASAALLLYGVYRLSIDPTLFGTEMRQLIFNFSALHGYEVLLVLTAAMLARRRIWYDASLLVVLDSMLWVVPFILASQAALLSPGLAFYFCLLTFFLAAGRVGWLRTRAGDILPPMRGLWCALPLLLVNAAWPVICRHFGETKTGTQTTTGAAYDFNELNWFWLLPALAALLFLLPAVMSPAKAPLRRWFPLLLFGLWLAGTGVHLYSLGYVYDFKLRREQLAPVLWVLAWALQFRLADFVPVTSRASKLSLLVLPMMATLPAALVFESRVWLYLSALNLLAYGMGLWFRSERRLMLQLALGSFAVLVATLPPEWAPLLARTVTPANTIGLALLIYAIVGSLVSRNPKAAISGALATLIVGGLLRGAHSDWIHWATQAGFGYFLLHSLRWEEAKHEGAGLVRMAMAAGWVLHTFAWVRGGAAFVEPLVSAGLVMMIWATRGLLTRNWRPVALPVAAGLVMVSSPVHFLTIKVQTAPTGLLYVVGSFLLFGVGTFVALTKHRWHKHPHP
jgi:hypothetical protein